MDLAKVEPNVLDLVNTIEGKGPVLPNYHDGLTVEHILLSITVVSNKESAGQFDDSCAHQVVKNLMEYHGVKSVRAEVFYQHTKIEQHVEGCQCGNCTYETVSPQ